MTAWLNGATRLHYIVGDPIAQVKSPAGVTQAFHDHGRNAVCVPAHVSSPQLADWVRGVSLAHNVDGLIVTVPHKFACAGLCATLSERAAFLGTVNVMRRQPGGGWHGDMFDGLGFVAAMQARGAYPAGRKALLVGAGGAGSAIAHALVLAGVAELAIHDPDATRRQALIDRLQGLGHCPVRAGSADPRGFDLVFNASPIGMSGSDPSPVDLSGLLPTMFCGCVITQPAVTPFIEAARQRGCATQTGADMFAQVRDLMVAFLLEA